MPVSRRQKLLRSAKGLDWTFSIPSVYSLSSLGLDRADLRDPTDSKVAAFFKYVEGQRFPRGLKGSRPLKDTAIEVVIRNLPKLDELDDIPKHLVKHLWKTLEKRCMLSFHSWKLLSQALHTEDDATLGMLHYSKTIESAGFPLQVYTKPLTSKTFDYITSLFLGRVCLGVELVQLAEISNLGILEITNPDLEGKTSSGMGDLILRAWSREARTNGAFSVLRILRLGNHQDLTETSFQHIQSLPSLTLFEMRNCGLSKEKWILEAEKLGWRVVRASNLSGVLKKIRNEKDTISNHFTSDFQEVLRISTKAMWPGSRVHRVVRSDMQSFLAQSITNSDNGPLSNCQLFDKGHHLSTTKSSFDTNAAGWPDYVKEAAEGDEEWTSLSWNTFSNTKVGETWDSSYAACWTRIGEICEDQDLMMSGVRGIEQQTFVGSHLVSSVPMAYIRLKGEDQKVLGVPASCHDGLTLIRSGSADSRAAPSQSSSDSKLDEASSIKRKVDGVGSVRPRRKQRLDDILNGFNTGLR